MGALARDYFTKYSLNPNIVMEMTRHENALRVASTGYGMILKMDIVVMSIVVLCIMSAVLYQGIAVLEKMTF